MNNSRKKTSVAIDNETMILLNELLSKKEEHLKPYGYSKNALIWELSQFVLEDENLLSRFLEYKKI